MEDGINGRWIDFDAEKMAAVLSEFVSGAWKPSPSVLKHALDGEAYAQRLIAEFKAAA